jgi:hypothetical protein
MKSLLDQQAAKSRAIEEQFAFDRGASRELHRCDVSRLRVNGHIDDLAFDALDAALLAELAQESRIQAGVEVERVRDLVQRRVLDLLRRPHELVPARRDMIDAVVAELRRLAEPMHPLPVLLEADRPQALADSPETVDIAFARISPVDELDAELE